MFIAQDLIKLVILSSVSLHFTVLFRWGGKREAVVIGMSDIRLYCSYHGCEGHSGWAVPLCSCQ